MTNGKMVIAGGASMMQPQSIGEVLKLSELLANARGFVPSSYLGQPTAIAACLLTGHELGMGPMESLREIHVVNGRPTLSAAAMLARAVRAGVAVEWLESSDTRAVLRLSRNGTSYEQSWSIEDARRANLLIKSGPWQAYPSAMLRARCISAAVRAYCPDAIGGGGLYVPEEAESIGTVVEVSSVEDEERIAKLLREATTLEHIATARIQLGALKRGRRLDDAAMARLVDLGREAAHRVANAGVISAEGKVEDEQ
jgi:hypothetical protein